MTYPKGTVDRFGTARHIINTAAGDQGGITDQTALYTEASATPDHGKAKVKMTLEAYEAIAETIANVQMMPPKPEPVGVPTLLTVPARHLQCGDHLWGYSIYAWQKLENGDYKWDMVEPYTTKSFSLIVEEKKLDELSFPITKRGDAHSTSARNKALGLPEDLHQTVYRDTRPEPVAVYPVGTRIEDVRHFDRSQHILFACPEHPHSAWSSKDPRSSSIFPQSDKTQDCTIARRCKVSIYDYVVTHDYKPTRNG